MAVAPVVGLLFWFNLFLSFLSVMLVIWIAVITTPENPFACTVAGYLILFPIAFLAVSSVYLFLRWNHTCTHIFVTMSSIVFVIIFICLFWLTKCTPQNAPGWLFIISVCLQAIVNFVAGVFPFICPRLANQQQHSYQYI